MPIAEPEPTLSWPGPAIATWFVADGAADGTYFPQVGSKSDSVATQAVYWRCVVAFFASSLAVNSEARHVFFTNTELPEVDGIDVGSTLARWGVQVVRLPITWRLLPGAVRSWGNQFYVFDILEHWAATEQDSPLIVLDCDCLWLRPVDDMAAEIASRGALTYRLDADEHPAGSAINGLTREQLAEFVARHGGFRQPEIPYCGGEIYAASSAMTRKIASRARALWPDVLNPSGPAPLEEAHLLSAVYALEDTPAGTANPFIRRMWTTFRHNNLRLDDRNLTIWHFPVEKRTGFADLFKMLARKRHLHPARDAEAMGLTRANYENLMGFPRRRLRKLLRDGFMKLIEKLRA